MITILRQNILLSFCNIAYVIDWNTWIVQFRYSDGRNKAVLLRKAHRGNRQ